MSTVCKIDPMTRERRAQRRNLLRNPPRPRKGMTHSDQLLYGAILAELSIIKGSSRLTGDTKHWLFERGAKQLSEL